MLMYISLIMVLLVLFIINLFIQNLELSFFLKINSLLMEMFFGSNSEDFFFCYSVMFISLMVLFFSLFYMKEDLSKNRFFILTFFFIMSMKIFIFSKSLIILILGWEGLGLFSFLLIIYYLKNSSFLSGMLTLLINRLGDTFLILGMGIWLNSNMMMFINFYFSMTYVKISLGLICFFFFLTMVSKSPQYPLNSWLLAAMAAPTPISSLVHSSTLVTAGCFFFFKFFVLFFIFN